MDRRGSDPHALPRGLVRRHQSLDMTKRSIKGQPAERRDLPPRRLRGGGPDFGNLLDLRRIATLIGQHAGGEGFARLGVFFELLCGELKTSVAADT